jgi:hypothetical protein
LSQYSEPTTSLDALPAFTAASATLPTGAAAVAAHSHTVSTVTHSGIATLAFSCTASCSVLAGSHSVTVNQYLLGSNVGLDLRKFCCPTVHSLSHHALILSTVGVTHAEPHITGCVHAVAHIEAGA